MSVLPFSMLSRAILVAALLTACGAPQRPSSTGPQDPAQTPTPTAAPTTSPTPVTPPAPPPTAPMASEAQCNQAIDHILALILASPDVPESAKAEWTEKEPVAREQMLRDCLRELTVPQFNCLMSKQSYTTIDECK